MGYRKPWVGYAAAIASTAIVAVVCAAYDRSFGPEPVYLIPFLFPIALAGWLGGLRCALFTTALTSLTTLYFFCKPFHDFQIVSSGDAVRIGVFVVTGVSSAFLIHLLHLNRLKAEYHARESHARMAALERAIADRRDAERLLQDERERIEGNTRQLRLLLESLPQLVWTCTEEGRCDYLSRQWVEYTGVPEAEQLDEGWAAVIHADDLHRLRERWQLSLRDKCDFDAEYRIRAANGEYRWFKARSSLIATADRACKWFGTCTDIHEAKMSTVRLEEGTAALEARVAERTREIEGQRRLLDAVLDALPTAVIIADPTGRVTRMNRACQHIWGIAPASSNFEEYREWVGYWPDTGRRIEPHEWAMSRALLKGEICHGELVEFERFGDRSRRSIWHTGAPVYGSSGEIVAGVVASLDVTDRTAAEAAVRASEGRFQAFMDHMPAAAWVLTDKSQCVFVNRFYGQMAGIDPREVAGKTAFDLYPAEIAAQHQENDRQAIAAGRVEMIEQYTRPDGSTGELLVVKFVIPGDHGEKLLGGVAVDVTERKRAEAALRVSEERFQAFMAHAPIAAWVADADSRGVYTNAGFDRHAGLAPGAYLGHVPSDLWPAEHASKYVENNHEVLRSGLEIAAEEPFVRPDGSPGLAHVVKFPMRGPSGEPLVGGIAIDVTDRKREQEALAEKTQILETILNSMRDAVLVSDRSGRLLLQNRAFLELHSLQPNEAPDHLSELWFSVRVPGADKPLPYDQLPLVRATRGEPTDDLDIELETARSSHPWAMSVTGRPLRGPQGIAGGLIVIRDVTSQRRNEAALRASEAFTRTVLDALPARIAVVDRGGMITAVNRAWEQFSCQSSAASEVADRCGVGVSYLEVCDNSAAHGCADAAVAAAAVRRVLLDNCPWSGLEYDCHTAEERRWYSMSVTPLLGSAGGAVISHINITSRKLAEETVRESEERFRNAFEFAPIGMALVAPDGRWLRVNHSLCEMIGYSEAELLASDFQAITHPDDLNSVMEQFRQMIAGSLAIYQIEKRYVHKNECIVNVQLSVAMVRDDRGNPLHFIWHIMDITARKEAETALRLSDERFRRLVEGVADHAIFMLDTSGRVVSWNPAAVRIKGYSSDEILGRHFSVFYTPEAIAAGHADNKLTVAVAEGRYREEGERVRKDGSRFWADVTISTLRDEDGRHAGFVKFTHDITSRKRAEELIKASLSEKELLLKEIHHRVKNNLQIISALLHLQSANVADPAIRAMFEECRARVKSMALIHERLYRRGDLSGVDLTEYIRQLAADLYRAYRLSHESIRLDLDVTVPPLPIDVAIPCGLLLNEMISNCLKHAFKDRVGGRIGVTFRNVGEMVVLSVSDDGAGFPPGLDFRTSASFGLQLIHTLAEQLNGHAEIGTGNGATVAVTFPTPKEISR